MIFLIPAEIELFSWGTCEKEADLNAEDLVDFFANRIVFAKILPLFKPASW